MNLDAYVRLDRQFSFIPQSKEDSEHEEAFSLFGALKPEGWDEIDRRFRCVILAEAGAGKTEELRQRAKTLAERGQASFFIRIEDIEAGFHEAFEVGQSSEFNEWLDSTEEAWFFLDSIDEARLDNPRTFEKALRRFETVIRRGAHRAHIIISSRPYSWRPAEDRRFLDEILFFSEPQNQESDRSDTCDSDAQSALSVYRLLPLDRSRIRQFCENRQANDVDRLLQELERADLWGLAERPFDLEGILTKWADDGILGGRLDLLQHNIDKRLSDAHSSERAQRQPLNTDRAREGARRLAAAVVLTGQAGIAVPDSASSRPGIEAERVLVEWEPGDVRSLLERGIFNDIIYGAVRFRHRDVRELLAAEWFYKLLNSGCDRYSIESLIFRHQYGENFIAPRLRPILPWLILFDESIRQRVLAAHPEISVEGGDLSKLPFPERRKLLRDIVNRIFSGKHDRSVRDNSAISKIASSDLSEDTRVLIKECSESDDAVFFLGRLVWQGQMADCVANLVDTAVDSSRGRYARIASIRAIMTCGSQEEKQAVWRGLRDPKQEVPRELLAELVDNSEPNNDSVQNVLGLIDSLPPYQEFSTSGLSDSLVRFIERFPVKTAGNGLSKLIQGFHGFLKQPPFIDENWCDVSEEYAWLLNPAIRAVERLVKAQDDAVFGEASISLMLMVPTARFYRDYDSGSQKSELWTLVPAWPELNDAVYWASIEAENVRRLKKSEKPLSNDGQLTWPRHFWKFDLKTVHRLVKELGAEERNESEKLVALSTALRVYLHEEKPPSLLESLRKVTADNELLAERLESLLNPPVSESVRNYEAKHAERMREHDKKQQEHRESRETWIAELRATPERVRNPKGVGEGECTYDQVFLLREIDGDGIKTSRSRGASWQALESVFGKEVALAYRDAVVRLWRQFQPTLQSEAGNRGNSVPYALILAMAGLEIESNEDENFAVSLNESEAATALRYITWEINGFPSWFEKIYREFPELAKNAVIKEVLWELENTGSERLPQSILHDLVYHGAWLHGAIAPSLLEWIEDNPGALKANLNEVVSILVGGGIDSSALASIAAQEIAVCSESDIAAAWYALLVDCDPKNGIAALKEWLSGLESNDSGVAAQRFITQLIGGRHTVFPRAKVGKFREPNHLKSLYVLMHQYIVASEDINRSGRGAFTPTLRDDAQDARDQLFNLLAEIPGKETFLALKQLSSEHPDYSYRQRMKRLALKRAEQDGDLEPWKEIQISQFHQNQQIVPESHRQLYELTVQRLLNLKSWIERGNDSPWKTWRRVDDETEMRTLIAGWLRTHSGGRYTMAEEPELANDQRIDIWMHSINVNSPVPIELKLLDKKWSGPQLCERLRNQLAGDYIREAGARCGVFLLVGGSLAQNKRWDIDGQMVGLEELDSALTNYWNSISDGYVGIDSIDVIVIDSNIRGHVSST